MFELMSEKLERAKIIPVVSLENIEHSEMLANVLLQNKIDVVEIVFRTSNGNEGLEKITQCISFMSKNFQDLTVGAGTVINSSLAKKAIDFGAKFIISPGFNDSTVDYCISHEVPVFPGVSTASEIEKALERNLRVLKFFPSEAFGGIKTLNAFSGPFPMVKFIPTGGINQDNFKNYLECKNVLAVCGTWIVKKELIQNQDWKEIDRLIKNAKGVMEK